MYNLNYNVTNCRLNKPTGKPFVPSPRFDEYSGSIVVAIPGNIFTAGYVPVFNQQSAWDDISAYIRSSSFDYDTSTYSTPFQNLSFIISGSDYTPGFVTQSYQETLFSGSGYISSVHATGYKCLVANVTSSVNLTSATPFVIESWIAYEQTASLLDNTGSQSPSGSWGLPSKALATIQGNDGIDDIQTPFTTSSYWFIPGWGGQRYLGYSGPDDFQSGSSWFGWYPYERNLAVPATIAPGDKSSQWASKQWIHWAVSNTVSGSVSTIRQYINGNIVASASFITSSIAVTTNPNGTVSSSLWLLGSAQTIFPYTPAAAGGAYYSGSGWYIQDFRMYNGTNKNYTGSQFTPPESMVVGVKEPYPVITA